MSKGTARTRSNNAARVEASLYTGMMTVKRIDFPKLVLGNYKVFERENHVL